MQAAIEIVMLLALVPFVWMHWRAAFRSLRKSELMRCYGFNPMRGPVRWKR